MLGRGCTPVYKIKNMPPARLIAIPFVLLAAVLFYLSMEVSDRFTVYLMPVAVILALVFVLSPQINWYWYKRNPPDLHRSLRKLFELRHPYYQQLPELLRQRFRQRTVLIMTATDFMPQGLEKVPEDVKAIAASNAALLTLNREDYLFTLFEHVVIYGHPFPSPQFPDTLHASETYEEGQHSTLIFSVQHLVKGTLQPFQYFNVGLYEYVKAYRICFPGVAFPETGEEIWPALERISGFGREALTRYINLNDLDTQAVAVTHFFTFPERFKTLLPETFEAFKKIFG